MNPSHGDRDRGRVRDEARQSGGGSPDAQRMSTSGTREQDEQDDESGLYAATQTRRDREHGPASRGTSGYAEQRGRRQDEEGWGEAHASQPGTRRGSGSWGDDEDTRSASQGRRQGERTYGGTQGYSDQGGHGESSYGRQSGPGYDENEFGGEGAYGDGRHQQRGGSFSRGGAARDADASARRDRASTEPFDDEGSGRGVHRYTAWHDDAPDRRERRDSHEADDARTRSGLYRGRRDEQDVDRYRRGETQHGQGGERYRELAADRGGRSSAASMHGDVDRRPSSPRSWRTDDDHRSHASYTRGSQDTGRDRAQRGGSADGQRDDGGHSVHGRQTFGQPSQHRTQGGNDQRSSAFPTDERVGRYGRPAEQTYVGQSVGRHGQPGREHGSLVGPNYRMGSLSHAGQGIQGHGAQGYGQHGSSGQGYGGGSGQGFRDGGSWRGDGGRASGGGQPAFRADTEVMGGGASAQPGYRGVGPSSYQRSDERLEDEIHERLTEAQDIDASDITVRCKDGIATVEGTVEERRLKYRIEDLIEQVRGVRDVENRLRIARPGQVRAAGGVNSQDDAESQGGGAVASQAGSDRSGDSSRDARGNAR